jgi:diacylglycerol O-acyltransferase
MHHALVDGVAAIKLLERSFATSATVVNLPPPWAVGYSPRQLAVGQQLPAEAESLLHATHKYLGTSKRVASELVAAARNMFNNPEYISSYTAPKSLLNNKITASRRFAAQSYALARLQGIATREGCTVNDAILAMCGGALRAYLLSLDALPTKPLVAMVPVNIRENSDQPGNQISMILATLGTHLADPIERLHSIKRSTEFAKQRFGRMTQSEILGFSGFVYAGAGFNLLTGLLPTRQAFNIVISNVPGPQHPLYWNGAKLDAIYPVSVIMDGQSMNITLTSYNGNLDVGILACRKTLPKIQILLKLLEQELALLEKG